MDPLYFYVVDAGDGVWEIRTDEAKLAGTASRFSSYGLALAAATELAQRAWNATHVRSGVRVWEATGQWREERHFGLPSATPRKGRPPRQTPAPR